MRVLCTGGIMPQRGRHARRQFETGLAGALVCCVALLSCERYIDINSNAPERVLTLDALLCSADSVHQAYLFESTKTDAHALGGDGSFRVNVNGVTAWETAGAISNPIEFRAVLKEGDRIRLEADLGGRHVEAETEVMSPTPLPPMDTLMTSYTDEFGGGTMTRFRIPLSGRKGERKWYMLQAFTEETVRVDWVAPGVDYVRVGEILLHYRSACDIDVKDEPLLNGGIKLGAGDDAEALISNRYCIFSDETFSGGSYTLDISVEDFSPVEDSREVVEGEYSCVRQVRRTLRLQTISQDAYNYINAFSAEDSGLGDIFFSDPQVWPHNVSGGLGFVTVFATSQYVF